MKILALDISVHQLGWAYQEYEDKPMAFGTKSFSDYCLDYGFLFSTYKNWICDMLTDYEPELLAIEGTYPGIKGRANYLLNNLNGITHTSAYIHDIDRVEFAPTAIKKFITGNGAANKKVVMEAIKERGFTPSNYDESDALGVLLMAINHTKQKEEM